MNTDEQMKKDNFTKTLFIIVISAIAILILEIIVFIILIHFFWSLTRYTDIKDYQKCLDEHYYKDDVSHFPKTIPDDTKEAEFYCHPAKYDYSNGLILLKFNADKNYIESELKIHEYLNADVPVGTPQKVRYVPTKEIGINQNDLTFYVLNTKFNKNMYENGMFPYATGIGVSKNMDYILYYFYFPD